jgi:hypothetical protein
MVGKAGHPRLILLPAGSDGPKEVVDARNMCGHDE